MKVNKHQLLGLLTVLLTFNYMDRFAVGIVLQDIKLDLHLSDSQLGFLSGIAFALFYATLGVPIASWADRGNRVTIISLSAAVWSVAVTLCGAAASFVQLALIRVVVGAGEAGCVPASLSLISSHFTRDERPRAVSIYMQGISASFLIGCFAAGWLDEIFGWRVMFAVIGVPGIALALLARVAIKDPRVNQAKPKGRAASHQSLWPTFQVIWRIATFRHQVYSLAVGWFFSYGILQWIPTFFVRSFGLKTGALGSWLAVIYGVTNLLGVYWGGEWATRRAARNERLQLQAMAVVTAVSAVLMALVFTRIMAPNWYMALAWLGLSMLTGATISGPQFAVLQTVVPPHTRAISIAIVYLFGNLIGIGLGPWAVGALSDVLHPWANDESLRYSLVILCPTCVWSAWHLWASAETVAKDLGNVHELDDDRPDPQ
jgi:MFS family permease